MKFLMTALLCLTVLTGCAARDDEGKIIHNPDGSEKISFWRTTGLVVGAPLLIIGVVAAASAGGGGGGNNNSTYTPQKQYPGNCQHDSDIAADGSRCGLRSADSRAGGY
jgi:hypothetical protein